MNRTKLQFARCYHQKQSDKQWDRRALTGTHRVRIILTTHVLHWRITLWMLISNIFQWQKHRLQDPKAAKGCQRPPKAAKGRQRPPKAAKGRQRPPKAAKGRVSLCPRKVLQQSGNQLKLWEQAFNFFLSLHRAHHIPVAAATAAAAAKAAVAAAATAAAATFRLCKRFRTIKEWHIYLTLQELSSSDFSATSPNGVFRTWTLILHTYKAYYTLISFSFSILFPFVSSWPEIHFIID